jgi:NAD(P)-dependent dehydrogenase (short-subunit alcohol dehydrogenase family)
MAVVLVTGASSGIGQATAIAFARQGDLVFGSVRDEPGADRLASAATQHGEAVRPIRFDVTDDASVRAGVQAVLAECGGIDVLVNNAGIGFFGPIETTTDEQWHQIFDVNVVGVARVTRAVLPAMRAAGLGTIVNVSSVNGKIVGAFGGPYGASKFALEALSEALLFEVEPFGIRVALVEPGQFDTPIFGKELATPLRDSVYVGREQRLRESLPEPGAAADPFEAAEVIVDAASGRRAGFRHPAGADAESMLHARANVSDDEWLDIVRKFIARRGS